MKRLVELNNYLGNHDLDKVGPDQLQEYLRLLNDYVAEQMQAIRFSTSIWEQVYHLENIFTMQSSLMRIAVHDGSSVIESLHEIASDFDNQASENYAYLINKIRQEQYKVQQIQSS